MKKKSNMKVLFFDIETMANLGWVWGKYEQNVIDYEREWYMLCFAYKWEGDKKTRFVSIKDFNEFKKNPHNDYFVIQELHKLFEEADVIIAHNGDAFDIKKVNARFVFHRMLPPSPYKTVDTKKVAKRYFNFNSNKLDDLGKFLGVGRKVEHSGFDLWKGCAAGDGKSWKHMEKYNKQDVELLERVYNVLLPFMTNHPSHALFNTGVECPNCNSCNLQKRGTEPRKNHRAVQRYQCQDCGTWTQGKPFLTGNKTNNIISLI